MEGRGIVESGFGEAEIAIAGLPCYEVVEVVESDSASQE